MSFGPCDTHFHPYLARVLTLEKSTILMVRLAEIRILNDIFLEKIDVKLEKNKIPSAVR